MQYTALPYGLGPQLPICPSWNPWDLRLSTLFYLLWLSQNTRPVAFTSQIGWWASLPCFRIFSGLFFLFVFSGPSDLTQQLQGALVLPLTPSLLNSKNPHQLHLTQFFTSFSPICGTAFFGHSIVHVPPWIKEAVHFFTMENVLLPWTLPRLTVFLACFCVSLSFSLSLCIR